MASAGQLIDERSACFLQTLPETARLPNGRRIDTLRYGSGHWHGVLWHGKSVVGVERDGLHREKQRQLGSSGLLATRQYDPQSRLTRLTLARGADAPAPVRERRFEYDAQGNLHTILQTGITASDPLGKLRYTYDPVGQLLSAVQPGLIERFAFDPAGKLFDAAPATGNVLQRYGDTEYAYDKQGNATSKRYHPTGRESTWSDLELQYDAENRLRHTCRMARQSRHRVDYFYDAFSRRIAKRVEDACWSKRQDIATDQPAHTSSTTTFFVWDGDALAQEPGQGETVTYLYEPDSFVPLTRISSDGCQQAGAAHLPRVRQWDLPAARQDAELQTAIAQEQADIEAHHVSASQRIQTAAEGAAAHDRITHYHCDHLGTPRELTDAQGNVVWSGRYKAWGRLLHVEGEIEQPLRFQGQYEGQETGLFYKRYRYYDAGTARYLTRDPIGLLGGLNGYAYVQSPTKWIDPLGLAATCQKNSLCNPCLGKDPASEARGTQGTASYPNNPYAFVDTHTNMALKKGTILYALSPGAPPGFGVTNHKLMKSAGDVKKYHELTQVTAGKDSTGNPRSMKTEVQVYRVNKDICVAKGMAKANTQFGSGGATQHYVSPSDTSSLTPGIRRKI